VRGGFSKIGPFSRISSDRLQSPGRVESCGLKVTRREKRKHSEQAGHFLKMYVADRTKSVWKRKGSKKRERLCVGRFSCQTRIANQNSGVGRLVKWRNGWTGGKKDRTHISLKL